MAVPGDLCLIDDVKAYMGGASTVDTTNDDALQILISAASAFVARYLDRDLMTLGGQGLASIASTGTDSGGAFLVLDAPLAGVPAVGATVSDLTGLLTTAVVAPTGGAVNTVSRLYVGSTSGMNPEDQLRATFSQTYTDVCDGSGKPWMYVRQWPVHSLVSVTDLFAGATYPVSGIIVDADLPRLTITGSTSDSVAIASGFSQGGVFAQGLRNLSVTYLAGYSSTPADLSLATVEIVLLWFKNRDRIGISGEGMLGSHVNFFNVSDLAPATRLKLAPYRRTISGC